MTREQAFVAALTLHLIAAAGVSLHAAEPRETKPEGTKVDKVLIEHGDLKALFRDNSLSPKPQLSGIDFMFNTKDAPGFCAFDPDKTVSSAGLNFEHIIAGHESQHNKFAPRLGAAILFRLPDGNSVRLVRRREDCPWDVSSTFQYSVQEPHYVDFDFRCTPHNAELFGKRGYAIFFFADYMNDVVDVGLNFRGIDRRGGAERWIHADAPKGPKDWDSGGTYRNIKAAALEYDADQKFVLNNWSYDYPRYTQPFYYGRAANGMTLIMMFDRAWTERDEIRFSLFKFKIPKHPRPAWDFQYVIHKVKAEENYGFRGRMVWKKFVSPEDCQREYESWMAGLKKE